MVTPLLHGHVSLFLKCLLTSQVNNLVNRYYSVTLLIVCPFQLLILFVLAKKLTYCGGLHSHLHRYFFQGDLQGIREIERLTAILKLENLLFLVKMHPLLRPRLGHFGWTVRDHDSVLADLFNKPSVVLV